MESIPLNTAEFTKILQDSQLYTATRDRSKKEVSFCYNGSDNSQFAVVAFNPLDDSSRAQEGDSLYVWSTDGGFKEVTYNLSNGTGVELRACAVALPSYQHQVWSFNA